MGNAHRSPGPSAEYEAALRAFSQTELESLKKLYNSLAAQSGSEGKYVSASVFHAYFGIRGPLAARLFDVVTHMRKDQRLYFEDLIISKANYEKGSPDEIEDFMFQLLDLEGDGKVGRKELESVMRSILETLVNTKEGAAEQNAVLPQDCLQAFIAAAEFSIESEGEGEACMSKQDFRKLCTLIPSLKKFLGSLLAPQPAGVLATQIPCLMAPQGVEALTLLRRLHAWHIAGPLQPQEARQWALVYHSSIDGLSFNRFLGNISNVRGPTILVIKDKEGCIYGGYASNPWERQSDFYGDMKCFLFTLHPRISLYRPTGSNASLQWFASNYISESIPNGIGFGGRTHHFALFLSASFEHGHTRHSVTFNNPALSTKEEIVPDVIECWAVIVNGAEDVSGHDVSAKGTILERFKEDRQMLNMVGIANASDSVP